MMQAATDFIFNEKGEEVISQRHQKDYKKEVVNTEDKEPVAELQSAFTDVSFEDI